MEDTATVQKIDWRFYQKKEFPAKPREYVEFERYSDDVKRDMRENPGTYAKFWGSPSVYNYNDQVGTIRNSNRINRQRLLDMLPNPEAESLLSDYLPEDYLHPVELRSREDVAIQSAASDPRVKQALGQFGNATVVARRDWND